MSVVAVAACDDDAASGVPLPDAGTPDGAGAPDAAVPDTLAPDAATDAEPSDGSSGLCPIELVNPPLELARHVDNCSNVVHGTNPPASGMHYGDWPASRVYDKPVPWGFLVHALEHGAVVIAYNCPGGCADEVAAAKAVIAKVPRREDCATPPVILTPDPDLPVRFAASAWGHLIRTSCFDPDAYARFIANHVNMGPEFSPSDCHFALDHEATGWCP